MKGALAWRKENVAGSYQFIKIPEGRVQIRQSQASVPEQNKRTQWTQTAKLEILSEHQEALL